MREDQKPAEEKPPYDEELVALIREKGTAGLIEWRESNPGKRICLSGADLHDVDLSEAELTHANLKMANLCGCNLLEAQLDHSNLESATMHGCNLSVATLFQANMRNTGLLGSNMQRAMLRGVDFTGACLGQANLELAHLDGAKLSGTILQASVLKATSMTHAELVRADCSGANFSNANLDCAILDGANLQGATFDEAHLRTASLQNAILHGASFVGANLDCASLRNARISHAYVVDQYAMTAADLSRVSACGTDFRDVWIAGVNLQGANLSYAIVNEMTQIQSCVYDNNTSFNGVGLGSCRIDPGMRADLEYNVRRQNWERWYHESWSNWFGSWLWWPFWLLSDYGRSTGRLLGAFALFAMLFAFVYLIPTPTWFSEGWPTVDCKPFVNGLEYAENPVGKTVHVQGWALVLRSVYFSVVTMTTLGFGDIHANPESPMGHVLLMVQVMLGYVLLGGMITRLAIMFQGMSHK